MNDKSIKVGKTGSLKLPSDVCAKYNIRTGDSLRVVQVAGNLVLIPFPSDVSELAHNIEKARVDAKWDISQALKDLRKQRKRYFAEKYKHAKSLNER